MGSLKGSGLPLAQLVGGTGAAAAVFLSPLPTWAAVLIVSLAVVAVAVWLEWRRPAPAARLAAVTRLIRPAKTVLDDDFDGVAS